MSRQGFYAMKIRTFICVSILCLVTDVRSELTIQAVYSAMNFRLDSLTLQTFNLKASIETSIEAINTRIDKIEASICQSCNQNGDDDDNEIIEPNEVDYSKFNALKAFASEKKAIRRVLKEYGDNLAKTNDVLDNQMELMKQHIDNAVKDIVDEKFEIYEGRMNESMAMLRKDSLTQNITVNEILKTLEDDINEVHQSIANLKQAPGNKIVEMNGKSRIGFTAFLSESTLYTDNLTTVVFDVVMNNFGNGYNSSSGLFTAPETGLYLFYLNTESCNNILSHLLISVNGTSFASIVAGNRIYSSGSNALVAHMNKGEIAGVATATSSSVYCLRSLHTAFTGVLIF